MKGLSTILGSLIVTLITLSLSVPLLIYFNSINSSNQAVFGQSFHQLNNAISTKITVIQIGNTPSQIYLYNYGNSPAYIQLLMIGNKSYPLNITSIKPNQLIPLSKISTKIPNQDFTNVSMVIEVNSNYYSFLI